MEEQETVVPEQEQTDLVSEPVAEQPQEAHEEAHEEVTQIPLHALQAERRKRQESEQELRFLREQQAKAAEPDDESRYESATKEDLGKTKSELKREIQEESWVKENPDKFNKVEEGLRDFLKLRPNLAPAIEASTNRYEEAWTLMNALTPKQQQQAVQKPKPQAPGSPAGVPKAAAMSEAVDLMNMSDSEFNSWRQQRRGRR